MSMVSPLPDDTLARIDSLISIWSMRPSPNSEAGKAWETGARQGWAWAHEALISRLEDAEARAAAAEAERDKYRAALYEIIAEAGNQDGYDIARAALTANPKDTAPVTSNDR